MLWILLAIQVALSTRQKVYALDTSCLKAFQSDCPEQSPKGLCSGYFLLKGTKFDLIALSASQKAYARDSEILLFLNKSYARKQGQGVKATL